MESVQDSFNRKTISLERTKANLMNLYVEYEQARKLCLSEAEAFERSSVDRGDRDLAKTTKVILEDLRILVVKANEDEDDKRKYEERGKDKRDIKCRFHNRGFCKFGRNCKFSHSKVVCSEYREEGICRQRGCSKRHPRHCRYWTSKPEGCKRKEACDYLHVSTKRFSCYGEIDGRMENHEYDNQDDKDTCDQRDFESTSNSDLEVHIRTQTTNGSVVAGDVCELSQNNPGALQWHRRSHEDESEERYSVTKVGGINGQWIFTCKICESPFISQSSVKGHVVAKHVGQGN